MKCPECNKKINGRFSEDEWAECPCGWHQLDEPVGEDIVSNKKEANEMFKETFQLTCTGCKYQGHKSECLSHPCTPSLRKDGKSGIWIDAVDNTKETP